MVDVEEVDVEEVDVEEVDVEVEVLDVVEVRLDAGASVELLLPELDVVAADVVVELLGSSTCASELPPGAAD